MDEFWTKKIGCHPDNQSLLTLKSNTMKNTLQMYAIFLCCATCFARNRIFYNLI